ncbi:heptaprenyl diphosphate synthase component 1 [Bacillus timonensis]|nr:heptaprenyl diphosphate synthase component 1 [Bacillus timonensis]
MQHIHAKIAKIKEQLEIKMKHGFLYKFVDVPKIDEDKLLFLYLILKDSRLNEEKIESYILSTMLVQIALDTHENVSVEPTQLNEPLKERQLTVLAGDYYSGLYYLLLSEQNDIQMIGLLSEAIKDINESKIVFYQRDSGTLDELMSAIETIEASFMKKLTCYFQVEGWKVLTSKMLLLKRLLIEKSQYEKHKKSFLYDTLAKIFFPKSETKETIIKEQETYLVHLLDKYIDHLIFTIEKCLANKEVVIQSCLKDRMNDLLFNHCFNVKKIVEEG